MLAALAKFVSAVSASISPVQPLTPVVYVRPAIPVWRVRASLEPARLRRPQALAAEAMRGVFVLKGSAAITYAVSFFRWDHVMAARFATHPLERLPALFLPAALNTLAALVPVKMKSALAACAPCLLAVKTF